MTAHPPDLARRFRDHVLQGGLLADGDRIVVALSGGLDSVALLHLLRFAPGLPDVALVAAHLDHRMRDESPGDALWAAGLTRAWGVPLCARVVARAPGSEDEARHLRYDFFEQVRTDENARWVVTAHHADDQVETVLFRIARGTGLRGLRGMPASRAPGLWRPLLPFWRSEIEEYASASGLRWREDVTNAGAGFARNVLRNSVIPVLEGQVAGGTRESVLRLSRLARQEEDAWESLLPSLVSSLEVDHGAEGISFQREAFLEYHGAVRARLLRALVRQLGGHLDAAGTRIAVEFTSSGESGKAVGLTGALDLKRELGRLLLSPREATPATDRLLSIAGGEGAGEAVLAGARYEVRWGPDDAGGDWTESFDPGSIDYPLRVRAWAPGDRIRLPYGSKKLKKVFLESRLPRSHRDRTPVLVDAGEKVLWVPGLVRSALARPSGSNRELNIGVTHANTD